MIGAIGVTFGTALVLYLVLWIDQSTSPASTVASPVSPRRVAPEPIEHRKAA
jgi:hypothetical protein